MAAATPPLMSPMSPIDRSPLNSAPNHDQQSDFDMFDDVELAQVRHQLQTFVSQHEDSTSYDFTEGRKAITRLHWVNSSQRSRCHNSSCKARFTLILRRHHCRKCGEVFCARCLSFQRKLSPTAEYDPNGKLFMVCSKCFHSETQGRGQARIWTQTFLEMRRDILSAQAEAVGHTTQKPSRAHLEKECQRLVEGFSLNLTDLTQSREARTPESEEVTGRNILMRKLSALKNQVSKVPGLVKTGPPEWKKPDAWTSNGLNCQFCDTAFTMTYKKHNCYICGRLACLSCSVKDLLLYVPDKCSQEQDGKHARWAIIKVIGSPELEPDIRHYVRVCKVCRQALESVQVQNYEASIKGDKSEDCVMQMKEIFDNIIKFQDKIDAWLPKYKQLIDALEIAGESPKALPASRSNMQTLAKHQGDLTDYFTSFVVAVSRLKKLKPQTNKQLRLVKALMRCKFTYYNDNMYTFRKLKRQLELISPPEVLQAIQSYVDSQVTRPLGMGRNSPRETPRQTPNHTPRQTPNQTPRQTPNQTPRETPNQTPSQTPKQTHRQVPLQTPLDYDYIDLDDTEIDIDFEESEIGREIPTETPHNLEEEPVVVRVGSKGQTPGSNPELTWMWRMVGMVHSSGRKPTLITQMTIDGPELTLESEVVGKAKGSSEAQTDALASKPSTGKPEQAVKGVVQGRDGHADPLVSESLTGKQAKTVEGADVGVGEVDSKNQQLVQTHKSLPGQVSVTKMVGWVSSKVRGSTLSLDNTDQTDKKSVDETSHVQGQTDSSDLKTTKADELEQNDNWEVVEACNNDVLTDPQTSQQLANQPGQTVKGGSAGMDEVGSEKWPIVKALVSLPGQVSVKKMVGWASYKVKTDSLNHDNQEQTSEKGVDETDQVQGQMDPGASKTTKKDEPEQTDKGKVVGTGKDGVKTDPKTSQQCANQPRQTTKADKPLQNGNREVVGACNVDILTDPQTSQQLTNQPGQMDEGGSGCMDKVGSKKQSLVTFVSLPVKKMVGWANYKVKTDSLNHDNQEQTSEKGVDEKDRVQGQMDPGASKTTKEDTSERTVEEKVVGTGNYGVLTDPQTSQQQANQPEQTGDGGSAGMDEVESKKQPLVKTFSGRPGRASVKKLVGWVNYKVNRNPLNLDSPEQIDKDGDETDNIQGQTDPSTLKKTETDKPEATEKKDVNGGVEVHTHLPTTQQPGQLDEVNSKTGTLEKTSKSSTGQISLTKMVKWINSQGQKASPDLENQEQTDKKGVVDSGIVKNQTGELAKQILADEPGKADGVKVVDVGTVETHRIPQTSQHISTNPGQIVEEEGSGRDELNSKTQALPMTPTSLRRQIFAAKMFGWVHSQGEKTVPNHEQTGEKAVVDRDLEGQIDTLASTPTTDKSGQAVGGEVVGAVNVNSQTDSLVLQPPKDTSRVAVMGDVVGKVEVDLKRPGALKRFTEKIWLTKVSSSEKPASNDETLTDDQGQPKEGK